MGCQQDHIIVVDLRISLVETRQHGLQRQGHRIAGVGLGRARLDRTGNRLVGHSHTGQQPLQVLDLFEHHNLGLIEVDLQELLCSAGVFLDQQKKVLDRLRLACVGLELLLQPVVVDLVGHQIVTQLVAHLFELLALEVLLPAHTQHITHACHQGGQLVLNLARPDDASTQGRNIAQFGRDTFL